MKNNETLKPCPFCGGKSWMSKHDWGNGHVYYGIECCGKCEDFSDNYGKEVKEAKANAILAWNTRPLEDSLKAKADMFDEVLELLEASDTNFGLTTGAQHYYKGVKVANRIKEIKAKELTE